MKNLEHELFLIGDDMDKVDIILDAARVAAGHAYEDIEGLAKLVPGGVTEGKAPVMQSIVLDYLQRAAEKLEYMREAVDELREQIKEASAEA